MSAVETVHVLVVCTANIARSPLAEVLLRAHLEAQLGSERALVHSAGIHARYGDPAAKESMRIAEEWGLDLRGHRSQPLTVELVQASDLILGMSTRHRERAASLAPGASERAFTLRELHRLTDDGPLANGSAPEGSRERVRAALAAAHRRRPLQARTRHDDDIPDPYGGPFEGFVTMANTLVELTEPLLPRLLGTTSPQ